MKNSWKLHIVLEFMHKLEYRENIGGDQYKIQDCSFLWVVEEKEKCTQESAIELLTSTGFLCYPKVEQEYENLCMPKLQNIYISTAMAFSVNVKIIFEFLLVSKT